MKKKPLLIVGAVLLVVVAFVGYRFATTRGQSPFEEKKFSDQNIDIVVTYCRPYKKGRLIFGEEHENALQPYGKYWRLGANDATEISFNKDVTFAGQPVKAGKYRMYAVPGSKSFQISLNSELGKSGAFEPDYSLDVLKADIPVASTSTTEQFTISFNTIDKGAAMDMSWDNVKIVVPIVVP